VVANYRIPPLLWLLMAMGAGPAAWDLHAGFHRVPSANVRAWRSRRPSATKRPVNARSWRPPLCCVPLNPIWSLNRIVRSLKGYFIMGY
jgi:hypothetical protein